MKEKFSFIYDTVKKAISELREKQISVDEAKAIASLAKQANNVISTQLDAAKFLSNTSDSEEYLTIVGLADEPED